MDKLIVKGIPPLDGEYEFDIAGMLSQGHPECLTNREGHRIKVMTGVRVGQLEEAFAAGDNDVLVAFAAVIFARAGKHFDEDILWDAPMGSGLDFVIAKRDEEGQVVDVPPVPAPPTSSQERNGGGSSKTTSDHPGNDPSRTGGRSSETPMSDPGYVPAT